LSQFEEFNNFLRMTQEERDEHVTDLLASVAEVWIDDDAESIMVRGMVSSFRAFLDAASEYAAYFERTGKHANQYVGGLFMNTYAQNARAFATLSAMTDVKKSFDKKKGD
jgi:hypothetical protein